MSNNVKRFWALPPPEQFAIVESDWEELCRSPRKKSLEQTIKEAEDHLNFLSITAQKFSVDEKIKWWSSEKIFDDAVELLAMRMRAKLTKYRLGLFS